MRHQASSHNFLSVIFGILRKFRIGICDRKNVHRKIFDRTNFDRKIIFKNKFSKNICREKNRNFFGRKFFRSKMFDFFRKFFDRKFFQPKKIGFFSSKKIFPRKLFFGRKIFRSKIVRQNVFRSHIPIQKFLKIPKITLRKLCD